MSEKLRRIMFNKHNFAIHKVASKSNALRPALEGIQVTPTETIAADGPTLIRVKAESNNRKFKPFVLPKDIARLADVFMGKEGKAIVDTAKPKKGRNPILHVTKEKEGLDVPLGSKAVNGKFPPWDNDKIIPPKNKAKHSVCFNPRFLAKILSLAAGISERNAPVKIRFYGDTEPIRVDTVGEDGQEWTAVLMPIKSEHWGAL